MPHETEQVSLIFCLTPEAKFEDVERILKLAKVEITEPLAELGIVLGKGTLSQAKTLRELPQFTSIDEDQPVSIAPPDSPIQ